MKFSIILFLFLVPLFAHANVCIPPTQLFERSINIYSDVKVEEALQEILKSHPYLDVIESFIITKMQHGYLLIREISEIIFPTPFARGYDHWRLENSKGDKVNISLQFEAAGYNLDNLMYILNNIVPNALRLSQPTQLIAAQGDRNSTRVSQDVFVLKNTAGDDVH